MGGVSSLCLRKENLCAHRSQAVGNVVEMGKEKASPKGKEMD